VMNGSSSRSSYLLALAIFICGLGVTLVARADGSPSGAITTAAVTPTKAPAKEKPETTKETSEATESHKVDAAPPADPCASPDLGDRVLCVQRFSESLAAVCAPTGSAAAIQSDLQDVAKATQAAAQAKIDAENAKAKAKGEKAAPAAPAVTVGTTEASDMKTQVCDVLCPDPKATSLCNLDKVVATAAVTAAWSEIQSARKLVKDALEKSPTLKGAAAETPKGSKLLALRQGVTQGTTKTMGVSTGQVEQAAAVLLQGLAKLIVDRAKAEAVGWLLDKVGTDLCGVSGQAPTLAQAEIRKYWLPSVCSLALGQRLSGYGGGAAMLESLRIAIASDLEHWPGAAASFAPGVLYLSDLPANERPSTVVECDYVYEDPDARAPACRVVALLRTVTRQGITDILKGGEPLAALRELSTSYRDANGLTANANGTNSWKSHKLQATACGLGLPQEIHGVNAVAELVLPTKIERGHAAVLASLVTVPACFDIVQVVPGNKKSFNRLNTLFALEDSIGRPVDDAGNKVEALATAVKELKDAADALSKASEKLLAAPPPTLAGNQAPATVLETVSAYQTGLATSIVGPAQLRALRALITVADAGVALGQTGLQIMSGACSSLSGLGTCPETVAQAKLRLDDVRRYIAIARETANGDWSKSALSIIAAARQSSLGGPNATLAQQRLLRHIGLLVAIVTARDSDGVAKAIDEAAAPVGSWRAKVVPKSNTLSITEHAGLYGAIELRHGTYGADYEDWARHYQAPTVALPVGFELVHGSDCVVSPFGVFLPLIDPAAFLQYDAEKDAKLPGASVKTAFSPGLGLRFGLGGSPFSLMPMVVYRPGFRQWSSKFSGTGADALQFGLLFSADVTLLQLSHSENE
jgi:hypothetical protein